MSLSVQTPSDHHHLILLRILFTTIQIPNDLTAIFYPLCSFCPSPFPPLLPTRFGGGRFNVNAFRFFFSLFSFSTRRPIWSGDLCLSLFLSLSVSLFLWIHCLNESHALLAKEGRWVLGSTLCYLLENDSDVAGAVYIYIYAHEENKRNPDLFSAFDGFHRDKRRKKKIRDGKKRQKERIR